MNQVTKKTIEQITQEKIAPKAAWQFLLRDYFVWVVGALSMVIGSLAVAVSIYLIIDHDWGIYRMAEESFLGRVLIILPYFWIVILIIFGILAYYNVRHTKHGYKYNSYWVVLTSVGLSLLVGSALYATGMGAEIDDLLYSNIKPYRQVVIHRMDMWQKPNSGRLAGKIFAIEKDRNLVVITFDGKEWFVDVSQATIHPRIQYEIDEIIMMLGKIQEEGFFEAQGIMPWRGRDLKGKTFLFKRPVTEQMLRK